MAKKSVTPPPILNQEYARVSVDVLKLHPRNIRQGDTGAIYESIEANGFYGACVVQRSTNFVLAGNHRLIGAKNAGLKEVPVIWVDVDDEAALRIMLVDNRTNDLASNSEAALAELLTELARTPVGLAGTGFDGDDLDLLLSDLARPMPDTSGDRITPEAARKTLAERFGVPPFSVLDARQGYWQDRKRAWLALGIQSELGRGENPQEPSNAPGGAPRPATRLRDGETVRGDSKGKALNPARCFGQDLMRGEGTNVLPGKKDRLTWVPGDREKQDLDETSRKNLAAGRKPAHSIPGGGTGKNSGYMFRTEGGDSPLKEIQQEADKKLGGLIRPSKAAEFDGYRVQNGERETPEVSGTSIFDPVLCELAYRWFCPPEAQVLDPFAGGSVRGVVASLLGYLYTGVELRGEQVAANEVQGKEIGNSEKPCRWITGDSRNIEILAPGEYDFVFSCPPYADLERYSEDPQDISTLEYREFLTVYRGIIAGAVGMLKPERFACFVVGDVRDRKRGFYHNFVSDTIQAFLDAGMELYNEAILITSVGSLPIRVGKQFGSYRKLGKTHQNVLVFYKGNQKNIPGIFGDVDFTEAEETATA